MGSLENAAMLLLGMGQNQAAQVLKHMPPEKVEKIVAAMNTLKDIDDKKINSALNKFVSSSKEPSTMVRSSSEFVHETLVAAVGKEKAESIYKSAVTNKGTHGVSVLRTKNTKTIVDFFKDEHPQVIAIILSFLDSEQAAETLNLLPEEVRASVLKRIVNIGAVSPYALQELDKIMEEQSAPMNNFTHIDVGGTKTVANIMNHLDSETEAALMTQFTELGETVTEKIHEYMFPFENLADLDDRSLQKLLREVANETLVIALKGCDDDLKARFFKNMSERAADMIKDDMEAKGPVPVTQVQAEQKEIVRIAQRMGKEGEIIIGTGGDEMVE